MNMGWIEDVIKLSRAAGHATLPYHPGGTRSGGRPLAMHVHRKSDSSPVTLADLAANEIIVKGLSELTPDIPIVSEEIPSSEDCRGSASRFWLVDPLDGTREFISGGDDFTVNIALIDCGEPLWGVVYAPAVELLYWGGQQTGSFRQQRQEIRSLRVGRWNNDQNTGSCVRVVASKSHMNAATRAFIDRLGKQVDLVQAGSSLKFGLIAQGDADLYPRLGDTCEWDTAAAQAVLEGAGGVVCDLQGKRLRYGKPNVLNPHFLAASSSPEDWLPG